MLLGSQSQVNQYYLMFDCLIHPSLYERSPMVLIEAQANGLHRFISDTIPDGTVILDKRVSKFPLDTKIWFEAI